MLWIYRTQSALSRLALLKINRSAQGRRKYRRKKKGIKAMKANLPKGLGGGPQNMQSMIKQAQKMQEQMEQLKSELDEREYTVQAGGGAVTVVINGKKEIQKIDISKDIVDPDDIETLEDVLTAAFNEAIKRVEDTNEQEMSKVTGNISLPGMF